MEQVKTAAIVLAAGHGKRMHSKVAKQYLLLKGEPVVVHALRAFEKAEMDEIILVAGADEVEFCKRNIVEQYGFTRVRQVVAGGKERYDSVRNGLCALKTVGFAEDGIVLIHDGARPLVNGEIIARAVDEITLESTSRPFFTTAAAVSSQELSIASIYTSSSTLCIFIS